MFDFKSINRLINYDWKDIFERIVPKDNKEKMDKQTVNDLLSGAILKCISDIITLIATIILVFVISSFTEELFGGVNLFGITEDLDISISFPISISLAILIYTLVMKDKEQSSLLHFIVLIYSFVNTLSILFGVITWVASMFINPIIGIIGFVSLIINLVGNLFVIIGCLDFCVKTKSEYIKKHTVYPDNKGITTKPISVNDVSMHINKYCAYCGNKLSNEDNFCKSCGGKVER